MQIQVVDASLPENTYISVRYGDQRRQAPFRRGEVLTFPEPAQGAGKAPKAYTVDVLRKVGQKQISLAGITALGGNVQSENLEIPSLELHGAPITVSLAATLPESTIAGDPKSDAATQKQQIAIKAKNYLEKCNAQVVLHDMFARLLEAQPQDPLTFMIDFLERQREKGEADVWQADRDFAAEPGLGPDPYPGFGIGGPPAELPDLSKHHSLVADMLRANPGLYTGLREERTELGVSLADCIKAGVDCPGHSLVKFPGAFAGDQECYERFWGLFQPIITSVHSSWVRGYNHPKEGNPAKLTTSMIDPTGQYALSATMEARRNFSGLRLLSCCSREERREVERIFVKAIDGDLSAVGAWDLPVLQGSYLPLQQSQSYSPKTGGMTTHQQQHLETAGMLFSEPDSRVRLSAGLGRDWPDARGVFIGESQGLSVWCNEEDHLRFFARQRIRVDIKKLWKSIDRCLAIVQQAAAREGKDFMHSDRLGWVTTCPTRLGAALAISVTLRIPLLAASTDLSMLCQGLELRVSEVTDAAYGGVWRISSGDCLGVSEVDLINIIIEGCSTLVRLEQRLERGEPIYDAMPGLGDQPLPGFSSRCPMHLPDLMQHNSVASTVLRKQPDIYARLRKVRTEGGVGFAPCIKPGMDDRGRAAVQSAGIVAGDVNSYQAFHELFDPVICELHGGELPKTAQPCDSQSSKLSNSFLNSAAGLHVRSVQVEVRRNLKGLPFAPCCTREQRQEAERLLTQAMARPVLNSSASRGGEYLPLAYSQSCEARPGGISWQEQARLVAEGLLFPEPTSVAQLAAGLGRQWPDARGAYLSQSRDLSIWCNEEDHLRFRVQRAGADLKAAFGAMWTYVMDLEKSLQDLGASFAWDERLGFLTVDPKNIGCALRCSVVVSLPCFGAREEFVAVCKALGLEASKQQAAWEVSSGSTLGLSEVDAANEVIEGCAMLVELEEVAAKGEDLSEKIQAILAIP